MKGNYSWSNMARFMTDCGVPVSVLRCLADQFMSVVLDRPVLNLEKFDVFLHEKYGEYENQGKSMADIFKEFFGDKSKTAEYYFGIREETFMEV